MGTVSEPEPNFTPRLAERFLAWILSLATCSYAFVTPTLHCRSWVPYTRAMLPVLLFSLLPMAGLTAIVLLILLRHT